MHEDHYERLADSYDDTWAHGEAFLNWMTEQITSRLAPAPTDRVADVGGGTGLFCTQLAEASGVEQPILCVDSSAAMLANLPHDKRVTGVHASMEEIAVGSAVLPYAGLDAVLVKEAIHHARDPRRTLAGLAYLLRPGGRLLVVTLPPRLEYPLFAEALDRFAAAQPEPGDLAASLRHAGLDVDLTEARFQHRYGTERYLARIRRRCMSVLSTFDDDELERGIETIRAQHPGDVLRFTDRFAFVLGTRPAHESPPP